MKRAPEPVPQAQQYYAGVVREIFGIFDKQLETTAYLAGSDYSIADIACYPDVRIHGKQGMGLDAFPNLARGHDAIEARPAVQRAWAIT